MAGVGSACLAIGLLTALYASLASVVGARTGRREWTTSGRRAIYCLAGLMVAAFAILESAFLRSDFSYALVAEGSSTDTPTFYKVTAVWATQDGSLLLWAMLLALFSSVVLFTTRRQLRELTPYATAVLAGVASFFLLLMVAWENPFRTLAEAPVEGNGLNPPLRPRGLDLPGDGHPAWCPLVLHRARLGRLLGLGPGGERLADAVAHRHRVPPLDHGAGAARDAE